MKHLIRFLIVALAVTFCAEAQEVGRTLFDVRPLPPLPTRVQGPFVGVHGGALLVAGGVDASGRPSAEVYILPAGATSWLRQPWPATMGPRAFGASASSSLGVLCAGGQNESGRSTADAALLAWNGNRLEARVLPPLPTPVNVPGAAVVNTTAYVMCRAGKSPDTEGCEGWKLDLATQGAVWTPLPPLPGTTHEAPRLAALEGTLYVLTGGDPAVAPGVSRLYRLASNTDWVRLADAPVPTGAAPMTAFGKSLAHLLVFPSSPSDGSILAYHTVTDRWARFGGGVPADRVVAMKDGVAVFDSSSGQIAMAVPRMRQGAFKGLDYLALLVYFVAMVAIGAYFAKAQTGTGTFFLGQGRVPWWAVGLSIFGTAVSAITYLSFPAKAFATDWVFMLAGMGTLFMAPVAIHFYLPHYRQWPITTAYEYLEKRFNFAARIYGSLVFLSYQVGRVGIVLFLPSLALSATTGLDVKTSILLMGVLSTLYTMLGGIEAVIWTDVVQAVILIGGAVLVLLYVVVGVDGGAAEVVASGWRSGKMHTFNWTWDHTKAAVWVVLVGNLFATAYPMTADQTIVQRYLTTATEKQAARAIWTNAWLTIPTSLIFFGLGTALWVFYRGKPHLLDPMIQPDAIMPLFIAEHLPAGLSGLIVAAVFAAAMSTLSSSLNSVSSVLVNDFYRRLRPAITDAHGLGAARGITAAFGVFGTGLALVMSEVPIDSLLDVFYKFLNLVGGGLAAVFALGVFTRRANGAGVLVGATASAVVLAMVQRYSEVHFFLHAAIGFVTCYVIGYGASLLGTSKSTAGQNRP